MSFINEYPRPKYIREPIILLDGIWNFRITKSDKLENNFFSEINVPYCVESKLSNINKKVHKDDYLHYRKFIEIPTNFNKGRIIINFNAVDQICSLYINRKLVGSHEGGYIPFSFDITDYLVLDAKNEIYLLVQDDTDGDIFAKGKQTLKPKGIFYTATSGIWQSVFIETVPINYLKSVSINANLDEKTVEVSLDKVGEVNNVSLEILFKGECVYKNSILENNIKINLDNIHLWSPDEPNLYDVIISYDNDLIKTYFGFRKFSIKEVNGHKYFSLNNKPILLKGVLDQGYHRDGILTPPNEEAIKNDILIMKDMGFNTLRKHIKIDLPIFYYYCDKYGMLVWQDFVSGGVAPTKRYSFLRPILGLGYDDTNYKHLGRANPKSRNQFVKELKETIQYLKNTNCICGWTLFNESWGQFDSKNLTELLRELDSTRFIDSYSGWYDEGCGDCNSKHIYTSLIKMNVDKSRVSFLSEFGGGSYVIDDHKFSKKECGVKFFYTEKAFVKHLNHLFKKFLPKLITKKYLSGYIYTQLSDVEDELNGLITYDREVIKISKEEMKKLNNHLDVLFYKDK